MEEVEVEGWENGREDDEDGANDIMGGVMCWKGDEREENREYEKMDQR